jgi:hypothetical protein
VPGADTVVHDAGWDTDRDADVTVAYLHLRQHAADHRAADHRAADHAASPGHADAAVAGGGGRSGANAGDRLPSGNGLTRRNDIASEMVTVP